jgi:BCD family chlorophyll transporter-like MFS transporter
VLLCVLGVILAPYVVLLLPVNYVLGLLLTTLTFMAWGMGFNIASVSYLSLASELSGEKRRSGTVSLMWFMMITAIIITAASLSRLLQPFSPEKLESAFLVVAAAALILALIGLLRLEPRQTAAERAAQTPAPQRVTWQSLIGKVLANPQGRVFFIYLIILLAAILGQDVILEPYAAEAFGLPVDATTRITSIWGGCVLVMLLAASWLEPWLGKKRVAQLGAGLAVAGFAGIAVSGSLGSAAVFYSGVLLLGCGTGLATTANLSLMLDMTTSRVGLYIGAWGIADALARLLGSVMGGVVRDVFTWVTRSPISGYQVVFVIEGLLLVASLLMLRAIDVHRFQENSRDLSLSERAALMNES